MRASALRPSDSGLGLTRQERGTLRAQVIVVNGPPGAGKSRVTAELRLLLPSSVAISGDALRAFAPVDARAHLGGGATYRAAGALARAYLELGAERVILDYLFLRAAHFRYFSEALSAGTTLNVFTLWPPLETLLERRRDTDPALSRSGDRGAPQPIPGVVDCHREMSVNLASMGEILDSAQLGPALIARLIHERCSNVAPHM